MIDDILIEAADAAERSAQINGDDYTGSDGLLYCGKCHTPKQCRVPIFGSEKIVYCVCDCEERKIKEEKLRLRSEHLRGICFSDEKYKAARFSADDWENGALSKLCRRYVETFSEKSKWLVIFGECGTGKSYAAAMIANALIENGDLCRFVTISEIERLLWNNPDKSSVYEGLWQCDLLIIDDFGAERSTDYMDEIKFNVIDGRMRSGRPCIITSNLSVEYFSTPGNLADRRLVSRIMERAARCEVKGNDRRTKAKKEDA